VSIAAPVLNVCTGQATSVLERAVLIAEVCGTRLMLRHHPARAGEIRHSCGSPARLRGVLRPGEPTGLRFGLGQVVEWLRAAPPGPEQD